MFIPNSTYRLQLNDQFTLRDLKGLLDYLEELGISTVYASPITTATKGSNHGYDVTDPLTISPDIGTEPELQDLAADLRIRQMSWLQDIVPNHMAYDTSNPWLYDVLERGRASRYYAWFDITTNHPVELLGDKLMAPFLGSTLTECLKRNELTLQFTSTGFVIRYFDKDYPVAIQLYRWIVTVADGYSESMISIIDQLEQSLSAKPEVWKKTKMQCLQLLNEYEGFITARVAFFNQHINLLESLLQHQHYILTHHHLAATHINYRRFFTVNSLICLRMERPDVFAGWHSTIHRWYHEGLIQGLRIDHIDGLAEPKKYLQQLRQLFGKDCYIVAEKILTRDEILPPAWPIQGTTGYDFLAAVNQLFTDADGSRELLAFYGEQVIRLPPYDTIVYERKLAFLLNQMGGELDNLMELLMSLPLLHAATQDKHRLREALGVWMASFPTYRGYPDENTVEEQLFTIALNRAGERKHDLLPELYYIHSLTTGSANTSGQRLLFLNRLMQFTGPLAAKGVEDTSFYVYNPYIGRCEVGDTPGIGGITVEDFHRRMQDRRAHQRYALNTTTTHDTKRGEDSRIRLATLTADPSSWIAAVKRWWDLNRARVTTVNGRTAPSPNDEYLIYQALLGGFPEDGIVTDDFRQRFSGYLTKALREAKTKTNYDQPDLAYEEQCQSFATALLQDDSPFLEDFIPFAFQVIRRSAPYSLAQLLLKLTAPGIPDIYQGAELWDTSFVDPDNRRPVDFDLRKSLLQQIRSLDEPLADFLRRPQQQGIQKMFTLKRVLYYRRRFPQLFTEGEYIPVRTRGALLAYIRRYKQDWALIGVPIIRYETPFPSSVSLDLPPDTPPLFTDVFSGLKIPGNRILTWPEGLTEWPLIFYIFSPQT